MSDFSDLIERLRELWHNEDLNLEIHYEAANALEAQAKRIAELEAGEPACFPEWVEAKNARISELEAALTKAVKDEKAIWIEALLKHIPEKEAILFREICVSAENIRNARKTLEKGDE